jgi:malate dehydrogenase (oxaloacetate-decarboxylating)(NADP+)
MTDTLREAALDYHRLPTPGKISVTPTKGLTNQRDLSLAYSPGVAYACLAIRDNPLEAASMTSRANLVAVVSNGTAVLGLGNIGALAGKPVMEGKGCLFKKFAGIDVFDIEINETNVDKIVDIVAALEPTFGGINLEDIKAPECFQVERKLRERMKIPVFHDDQHGTAIIVGAAVLNGLKYVGKDIGRIKLAGAGAGAAMIACLDLLVSLGLKRENIAITDSKGVVHKGRKDLDPDKARYAVQTDARTLADIVKGADIFLGLSQANVMTGEMVNTMTPKPLILALANPDPEIRPEVAREARPDCLTFTGRSDYPNQVNNVLCFPFIFRGALDVGATTINEPMKLAAVKAIAELAHAEASDVVAGAYVGEHLRFGPEYLIPKPFDPRLIERVSPAVAKAAMDSGVAQRPIADLKAYRDRLAGFAYRSGTVMQPVFDAATGTNRRIVYAEGEDDRVLRAVQAAIDERLAKPILIGRPDSIAQKVSALGLRLEIGRDVEVINFDDETMIAEAADEYYQLRCRRGIAHEEALAQMRRNATLIGAMLLRKGRADGMLCGTVGTYKAHLQVVTDVIGPAEGVQRFAAMHLLMLPEHMVFICDTYINLEPDAEQIADMTLLAADAVRRFGVTPRAALLSHSNFGSSDAPTAQKMVKALELIQKRAPDLEVDGEMHADAALSKHFLDRTFPDSRLTGNANLLIMPNLDAANITFNALKVVAGQGVTVGPILLGTAKPAHILTPTSTVRRLVNMTALTAVQAELQSKEGSASENRSSLRRAG